MSATLCNYLEMLYPCPACGFEVFDDVSGSYDICPVCDWEDDGVQLKFPVMQGGANGESLFEKQQKEIKYLPLEVKEIKGYKRDPLWRPLSVDECKITEEMPKTGREYFDSLDNEIPEYYWRK